MVTAQEQRLFTIGRVAQRWGISRDTVRRLVNSSALHSVLIGGRRLVSLTAIEKAESTGVGVARKRRVQD